MTKNKFIQLKSIDWDFFTKTKGTSGKIHWYPGTFPQEIPSALIQSLTSVNDIVFDPYGGVGTTACEALRLGRRCIISDINPAALLSTYVSSIIIILKIKNELLLMESINSIRNGINSIFDSTETMAFDFNTSLTVLDEEIAGLIFPNPNYFFNSLLIAEPNWDALTKWIEKNTLAEIQALYTFVIEEGGYVQKLFCLAMISNILYSCSSQTKSWGHIADNVYPKECDFTKKDVKAACNRWLNNKIFKMLKNIKTQTFSNHSIKVWVINQDWNSNINQDFPEHFADLLLTSPPYANAIDYLRSQKLSLYLFGYTDTVIELLTNNEIGVRKNRKKTNSMDKWAGDLILALIKQESILKGKSISAFILPHKESGRQIGREKIIEHFKENKSVLVFEQERSINQMSTTQSWTSILKEEIIIFENKEK